MEREFSFGSRTQPRETTQARVTTTNSIPAASTEFPHDFNTSIDQCHDECHGRSRFEIGGREWLALIARIARRTIDAPNGCRVWTGARSNKGHGRMKFGGRLVSPHRVVLEHVLGRRLARNEDACHHCDNPPCVRPDHLFAGSRSDNMVDASRKGRLGKPMLGYDMIKSVVREYRGGHPQAELAERFGLSAGMVSNLVKGKTRLAALALAEVDQKPYRHPRASLKRLAKCGFTEAPVAKGPSLDDIRQWLAKRRGDVG